jgi:hypothetical protein
MKFNCVVSKVTDKDKETLYSIDFEVQTKDPNFIKTKNAVPIIIDSAIDKILETNIPETLDHMINSDLVVLDFNIIGEGTNIHFDIKDKNNRR